MPGSEGLSGDARTVLEALAEAIERLLGEGAAIVEPGPPPSRHAWSYQFRPVADVAGRRVPLVVKVPIWDEAPDLAAALTAGPQDDTREEAAALAAIAAEIEASGETGLAAVRCLGYVASVNAIVMERFDGTSLREVLGGGGERAVGAAAAAGRWLRLYHDRVGGTITGPFPVEQVLAEVDELSSADVAPHGWANALRDAAGGLRGSVVRMAPTHGDFGAANVLVDGAGRVAGIDPNRIMAPVVEDLARLWVDFVVSPQRALLLGLRPSSATTARWTAALLAGYGPTDLEVLEGVYRPLALWRRRRGLSSRDLSGPGERMGAALMQRLVRREFGRVLRRPGG